jgi:hypothetical protein
VLVAGREEEELWRYYEGDAETVRVVRGGRE